MLLGDSITKGPSPCTKQLMDVHEKYVASTISLEEVPKEKVERYGIIKGIEVEKTFIKLKNSLKSLLFIKLHPNRLLWGDMF